MLPFSIWARQQAVVFLLRAIAAPVGTLLHQALMQLYRLHQQGQSNWLSIMTSWIQRWDARLGLTLTDVGGGWDGLCFRPTTWDELAPQRRWRFPGGLQGWADPEAQTWRTTDYVSDDAWWDAWLDLMGWSRRVAARFAAWDKKEFFLRTQYNRVCQAPEFSKSRMLKAIWLAGSSVGMALPIIGPRVQSPRWALNGIAGAARRSVVARLFVGDFDIGAFSGN